MNFRHVSLLFNTKLVEYLCIFAHLQIYSLLTFHQSYSVSLLNIDFAEHFYTHTHTHTHTHTTNAHSEFRARKGKVLCNPCIVIVLPATLWGHTETQTYTLLCTHTHTHTHTCALICVLSTTLVIFHSDFFYQCQLPKTQIQPRDFHAQKSGIHLVLIKLHHNIYNMY
jgi:hypothetical protein